MSNRQFSIRIRTVKSVLKRFLFGMEWNYVLSNVCFFRCHHVYFLSSLDRISTRFDSFVRSYDDGDDNAMNQQKKNKRFTFHLIYNNFIGKHTYSKRRRGRRIERWQRFGETTDDDDDDVMIEKPSGKSADKFPGHVHPSVISFTYIRAYTQQLRVCPRMYAWPVCL